MINRTVPSDTLNLSSDKDNAFSAEFEASSGKINYIKLMNWVWDEMQHYEGCKTLHITLFLAIVDSVNRNMWKRVALPYEYILNKCKCDKRSYLKARQWLTEKQLLEVIPGKNVYTMATFSLGIAVQKSPAIDTAISPAIPPAADTAIDTHYKTDKPLKRKPKTLSKELNIVFEEWYLLYDKNIGEKTSRSLWSKLTDEERVKALEHTPKYVAATPDIQYRQNPKRYLEEKTFNSAMIPTKPKQNNQSTTLENKEYGKRAHL